MELILICAACGRMLDFSCAKNTITVDVCPCRGKDDDEDLIYLQDDRDYPLKYC
jgi:hypothetical protein